MPNVYLIGFRGTGLNQRYESEPALIRVGHVGFAFEKTGDSFGVQDTIWGFHPSASVVEQLGGETAAIQLLKKQAVLDGLLHIDTEVFLHAAALARRGAPTTVWELERPLSEVEHQVMQSQVLEWYSTRAVFKYAFPSATMQAQDADNCATFPRRLGIELPEQTGQLIEYIGLLKQYGRRWA